MFSPDQYQLLDFGDGRKLERFGELVLDRPCLAAEQIQPANSGIWATADARFDRDEGDQNGWTQCRELPATWSIQHGPAEFELKRTPFGHLGLFVEQAANWDWIAQRIRNANRPPKVLNLFAYTGGSTLAAAAAGAEVVHVDAAANTVKWARRNAEISGLADAPIRWIVEDALKFVQREVKRKNRYDAVILDPPSYGRGPKGQVWRLEDHIELLLECCFQLTGPHAQFFLLSCHSPDYTPRVVAELLAKTSSFESHRDIQSGYMNIANQSGRALHCGVFARWSDDVQAEPNTQNRLAND